MRRGNNVASVALSRPGSLLQAPPYVYGCRQQPRETLRTQRRSRRLLSRIRAVRPLQQQGSAAEEEDAAEQQRGSAAEEAGASSSHASARIEQAAVARILQSQLTALGAGWTLSATALRLHSAERLWGTEAAVAYVKRSFRKLINFPEAGAVGQ